jgi:hypothetical protein
MGNRLINIFFDDTLTFSKRLAVKIGLNEALFLQQLHYWLQRSDNIKDGFAWVYNTCAQWQEQLPFFSDSTIKRTIKSLKEKGLIIVSSYNKAAFDHTKWYRIDYDQLNDILNEIIEDENRINDQVKMNQSVNEDKISPIDEVKMTHSDRVKMNQSDRVKMNQSDWVKMTRPIPENTTENTTENTCSRMIAQSSSKSSEPTADVAAIPLNDGTEWRPSEKLVDEYRSLYPNVEIKQAFNAMRGWCLSNPSKRKTRRGITAFVNRWLSKDQDNVKTEKQESKYSEDQFDYLYS